MIDKVGLRYQAADAEGGVAALTASEVGAIAQPAKDALAQAKPLFNSDLFYARFRCLEMAKELWAANKGTAPEDLMKKAGQLFDWATQEKKK